MPIACTGAGFHKAVKDNIDALEPDAPTSISTLPACVSVTAPSAWKPGKSASSGEIIGAVYVTLILLTVLFVARILDNRGVLNRNPGNLRRPKSSPDQERV